MISLICGILKKKIQNRNRPTDIENQTYGYQRGKGGGEIN